MPLTYLEWNDVLIKYYFNEDTAGKEVIIFADKEKIDNIAEQHGECYDDFKNRVVEGPPWARAGNICKVAYDTFDNWRSRRLEYPPYFAYLVFFVAVATIESDFSDQAYYPLLRQALGEEPLTGMYPSFDKIDELWEDLEKWSIVDMNESLGRFTKRLRDKRSHVGLPLSQVILSDKERKKLPQFFSEFALDPADPPTIDVIAQRLALWGRRELNRRTQKLFDGNTDTQKDLRQALAELVLNDLLDWNGICEITQETETSRRSSRETVVGAHICMEIDEFAGVAKASLRIKSNNPFPDEGLSFDYDGKTLKCIGSRPGWSSKLAIETNGQTKYFDPIELDWTKSYRFTDPEESWTSRFRGCDIRVFLPGSMEGLPGWIERQKVQPHTRYYVCCRKEKSEEIERWGRSENKRFDKIEMIGFEKGWELFSAEDIKASCPGVDVLTLPGKSILHIRGGIRIGRTNKFLDVAPPHIIVDEGTDAVVLTINGNPVSICNGNVYSFTKDMPINAPITIELRRDYGTEKSSVTQRSTIYIISMDEPETPESIIARDKFGNIIDVHSMEPTSGDNSTIKYVKGAIPVGFNIDCARFDAVVPTYLSDRIIFVGGSIGQIADWPREEIPNEWRPVWALAKISRHRWQACFCGDPDRLQVPSANHDDTYPRGVKRWKSIVYGMRKRIKPPIFERYKKLWQDYKELASHV